MRHPFCCNAMALVIKRPDNGVIGYDPRFRIYKIISLRDGVSYGYTPIKYCPSCGRSLPENLEHEWTETLKKEFGIIDPIGSQRDQVPEEFWSDKWWKKRDL